ncbi:hypothetical protein EON64_05330 [archaeon]|nr:MAG: hypothetical protein EON64_05330 [archaeon]
MVYKAFFSFRLTRLSMVKKEVVRAVEDSLIAGATNGRLQGIVTDAQLIVMLEQLSGGGSAGDEAPAASKKKIVIQRRKYKGMDEDDDDDDSDLL